MQSAGPRFNVCGFTQLLVPAFFMAFAVASLTSSDALGWLAAGATAATIAIVRRVRGTTTACAVPSPSSASPRSAATPVVDLDLDLDAPTTSKR